MITRRHQIASWLVLSAGLLGAGSFMVAQDALRPAPAAGEAQSSASSADQYLPPAKLPAAGAANSETRPADAAPARSIGGAPATNAVSAPARGGAAVSGDASVQFAPPEAGRRPARTVLRGSSGQVISADAPTGPAPPPVPDGWPNVTIAVPASGPPGFDPFHAGHPLAVSGRLDWMHSPARGLSPELESLVARFRDAETQQREELLQLIVEATAKEFDQRHAQQEQHYQQLVERMKRVRESLDRRMKLKDDIVRSRVAAITGGLPELQWDFDVSHGEPGARPFEWSVRPRGGAGSDLDLLGDPAASRPVPALDPPSSVFRPDQPPMAPTPTKNAPTNALPAPAPPSSPVPPSQPRDNELPVPVDPNRR